MPSASTKSENKPPVDPTEGLKQVLIIVDKKIRNLEKRKGKLDIIREKKDSGKELNPDQVEAIARYDSVLQNLELSREFQKQFTSTLTDIEKLMKKQQKREKVERQQEEQRRIAEVLAVQNVLDSMGADTAREDFRTGSHGAVQLSEENLNQLDELYKLISPTREDEEKSFQEQLTVSSEHFSNLMEGKEKEVIGTTYKDLKSVLDQIVGCGYLDRPASSTEETEAVAEEESERVAPPADEQVFEAEVTENGQLEEEVPGADEFGANEQQDVLEPETQEMSAPILHTEVMPQDTQPEDQMDPALVGGNTESEVVDDAFFSTAFHNKQRPFNEIVSSVQGKFDFLQDSEIEQTGGEPHMDPAIVAAHPLPTNLHRTDATLAQGLTTQTYQSSTYVDDQTDSQQQQSTQQTSHVTSQSTPSLVNQSELDNAYTQNYTGHMTHGLPDSSLHSMGNTTSSDLTAQMTQSSNTSHMPNADSSALPPQPIPMPNQTSLGQPSNQDLQSSQEKKFSMNANAAVFRSIYSQQSNNYTPGQTTTADNGDLGQDESDKDSNTQRGYNNYGRVNNRGGAGGRGGRGGGGQRGGNMSNGYSRGGNGNNRGNSSFNNNRVGSGFNNSGRGGNNRVPYNSSGNQGSGNFQPRTESYNRPEGFQGGYNNSSYGGYNKRGGNSRGGIRGNSMRGSGGQPRGNNTWRGGRGGNNNGKPNLGYQSQGQQVQQMS